jgi:hypothetical protein
LLKQPFFDSSNISPLRSPDFAEMPSWRQWEVLGKAAVEVMEPYEALAYSPEEVADAIQREGNFFALHIN